MSMWGKMKKASAEMAEKTVTSSKNTKETISIQKKENQIQNLKKSFGVDYIDMVDRNASEEELCARLHKTLDEIALLRGKQAKYATRIAINKEKLDVKLTPVTQPSITVTDASAASATSAATNTNTESLSTEEAYKAAFGSANVASASAATTESLSTEEAYKAAFGSGEVPTAEAAATASTSSNPFGDEDEEEDAAPPKKPAGSNPFGDDDDDDDDGAGTNPFGDDDDDDAPPAPAAMRSSVNPFDDEGIVAEAQPVTPDTPASTNPFDEEPAVVQAELVGKAGGGKSVDL